MKQIVFHSTRNYLQDSRHRRNQRDDQPEHRYRPHQQQQFRLRSNASGPNRTPWRPQHRKPEANRNELTPEEFFHLTREHFAVIKSRHHLQRLSEVPVNLQRAADNLALTAKPAFRNDYYDMVAKTLAEDWLRATVQSLRDHYSNTIEASLSAIRETPLPELLFQRSISLCTKWAHRQLGRRLDPRVLDAALSEIKSVQITESTSHSTCTRADTDSARVSSRTVFTQTIIDSAAGIRSSVIASASEEAPIQRQEETTARVRFPGLCVPSEQQRQEESSSTPTTEQEEIAEEQQQQETAPIEIGEEQETAEQQPSSSQQTVPSGSSGTAMPPGRTRKRQLELSQLDLFGDICVRTSPPRQRSRSLSIPRQRSPASLSPTSKAVILGDENLAGLQDTGADILALPNGRLNHYRNLLRASETTYGEVRHFVLSASYLDRNNLPASNAKALSHIFSMASRIFPNAKLAYACDGLCPCESDETKATMAEFNTKVSSRPPKGCTTVFPAPAHFSCHEGAWDDDTKNSYYEALRSFLGQ